jgi:hypothetical protein
MRSSAAAHAAGWACARTRCARGTVSRSPPRSEASTGTPAAIASTGTRPNGSACCDGTTTSEQPGSRSPTSAGEVRTSALGGSGGSGSMRPPSPACTIRRRGAIARAIGASSPAPLPGVHRELTARTGPARSARTGSGTVAMGATTSGRRPHERATSRAMPAPGATRTEARCSASRWASAIHSRCARSAGGSASVRGHPRQRVRGRQRDPGANRQWHSAS